METLPWMSSGAHNWSGAACDQASPPASHAVWHRAYATACHLWAIFKYQTPGRGATHPNLLSTGLMVASLLVSCSKGSDGDEYSPGSFLGPVKGGPEEYS